MKRQQKVVLAATEAVSLIVHMVRTVKFHCMSLYVTQHVHFFWCIPLPPPPHYEVVQYIPLKTLVFRCWKVSQTSTAWPR